MKTAKPLGKQAQDKVVDKLLKKLWDADFFPPNSIRGFPADSFHLFRSAVRESFYVPETSITPIMARILLGISASKRPRRVVGIGTYYGNGLVWLSGHAIETDQQTLQIVGCDTDQKAVIHAKEKFNRLPWKLPIEIVCEDGHHWLERNHQPIDLLYIDVDSLDGRKKAYITLLEKAMPSLQKGALVLAHDISVEKFSNDLKPYLELVRDRSHFRASIALEVDNCGLELSLL